MGGEARRAWDGRGSTQSMEWEEQRAESLTSSHLPETHFPHSLLCDGVKALDHSKQKIHFSGTLGHLHTYLPLPFLGKLNQTAQTALHHTQISGVEELVQHLGRGGDGREGKGREDQRNYSIRKW